MTVKQINESSHSGGEKSGIVINGVEITNVQSLQIFRFLRYREFTQLSGKMFLDLVQVSLVGLVCDKDVSKVTEVKFTLDDGTGRIDCKRW